jgi:transposase
MVNPLLPEAESLRCQRVIIEPRLVTIVASSVTPFGACPVCHRASPRVHSRYLRTLGDLPWQGRAVRITLQVRKFFCNTPSCPRRVFVERLPGIVAVCARKTLRLDDALTGIGFACGGEGGARLAGRLGMPTSPDTLLRRMRRTSIPVAGTPRALGIDDWAVRRGQKYGTILCDLERHCPIEVLDDRQAGTVAAWLRDHPGVEVITRDRASFYAEGATDGAPQAMQVADRFHLMQNLRQALVRMLEHRYRAMVTVGRELAGARSPPAADPPSGDVRYRSRRRRLLRSPTLNEQRRAGRLERYSQVLALHQQGISHRLIAKRLGINRETVGRYLRAGQFPERAPRKHAGKTDSFTDYLRKRWAEGCRNAAQLARELQKQGFAGSYYSVRRRMAHWHAANAVVSAENDSSRPPAANPPSARRLAWLLLKNSADLDSEDRQHVEAFSQHCPEVATAATLACDFAAMIRGNRDEPLDAWIQRAWSPDVPRQIRTFASGLRADYSAVNAALITPWSNGQVEGQVNRLKLIKRQMYGRAKFDLLRKRVLHMG